MIYNILKDYMEARPNDTFIYYNDRDITYENITYSLESRIKSMQAINIETNSVIGIYTDNSLDLIEILFTCIEIQVIPLVIPSSFKTNEIENLCNQVNFDYFITTWKKSSTLPKIDIPIFPIEELSPSIGGCAASKKMKYDINQTACLLLTSGTTGVPKIAQISIKNILANCNAWNEVINFNKSDTYFNCLPLHHIGGLSIIFRALLFGFKVVLTDKFDENLSIKLMDNHNISIVSLVPTMLSRIIKLNPKSNNDLRAVIIGGSDCSDDLIKSAIKKNFNVYKSYGMTESSSGVSGFWVKDNMNNISSSGTLHSEMECKISKNEILLKGPSIINQYYNGPRIEDWYHTNDRGYIDSNGFLYVLGRKDIIISGGENIDLQEIENTINNHPDVKQTFVKSIPDDEWGDKVIAYISCDNFNVLKLKDWLKTQLSDYKIPKEFIQID